MEIKRIQRVVIAVRNLEESAKRYADLLGITFLDLGVQEGHGVRAMVSKDWLVELISPVGPRCVAAHFLEKHGEGVMGVAFQVPNIDEARLHVENKGFKVLSELDFGENESWKSFKEIILDTKDTNGAPIIIVEAEPK